MNTLTAFHGDIKDILEQARRKARSAVNTAMVEAYWLIGQRIVQEEQLGQHKAQYGTRLIEDLSTALTADFGKGFSFAHLYNCRQFYLTFPEQVILYTVCRELSWSRPLLMSCKNFCWSWARGSRLSQDRCESAPKLAIFISTWFFTTICSSALSLLT